MVDPTSPGPTLEQLRLYAERFSQNVIVKPWGFRLSFPSLDRVRVSLDEVLPFHRGGLGTAAINGGVLAGRFDLTIGITAALVDPTRRSATMQLSINFEKPVTGNRIWAEGYITSRGATTLYSVAEIFDEAGQVCSRCQGLVRLGRGSWAGPSPGES